MNQKKELYEDEVDIKEIIQTLINRKKTVATTFFLILICGVIIALIQPRVYEISMLIEPKILDGDKEIAVDSTLNLTEKIKNDAFTKDVIESLEIDPQKDSIDFDVFNPEGASFVKVTMKTTKKKEVFTKNFLETLFLRIQQEYEKENEKNLREVERDISLLENSIDNQKDEELYAGKSLQLLNKKELDLDKSFQEAHKNTTELIRKRDSFIEDSSKDATLSSILYANVIQQNIAYSNALNEQILNVKQQQENILNNIKDIKRKEDELGMNLKRLEFKKKNIRNIIYLQKPELSLRPVGQGKRSIVMLAGILGLLAGCLLPLFQEFWTKVKYYKKNT